MHPQRRIAPGQRIHHQARPEVRAADAHAHHIGDARIIAQPVNQHLHPRQRGIGLGMRVARGRRRGGIPAQGGMQRRAAFGRIDDVAIDQPPHRALQVGLAGDFEQRRERLAVIALAGKVGVKRTHAQREVMRARQVFRHQGLQRCLAQARRLLTQAVVHDQAACAGIDSLVCVSRFSRST